MAKPRSANAGQSTINGPGGKPAQAGAPGLNVPRPGCVSSSLAGRGLGGRGPRRALALVRIEMDLPEPNRFRRHLDIFVVRDIGQRLLEAELFRRRQAYRLVLGRRADIGELLAL